MPDYTDVIASLMGGQLAAGPAHTAWPLPPAIGNLSSFLTPGVQMGGQFTMPGVGMGGPFSAPGVSMGGAFETGGISMGSGGVGAAGVLNTVKLQQEADARAKKEGKAEAEAGTKGVSNKPAGRTGGPAPADVPAEYRPTLEAAAAKYGVDANLLAAQIKQESQWNPAAYNRTSGASGLGQFMPATAAQYKVNPTDPHSSIDGAARYMADLQREYGGDQTLALVAYNGGPRAVAAWRAGTPFAESREYVNAVTANQQSYRTANRTQATTAVENAAVTDAALLAAAAPGPNGYVFPVVGYRGPVNLHHGSASGGSDLMAPEGTQVVAMRGGQVTLAGNAGPGGNAVQIQGDDGLSYYYAHLQHAPQVRVGQTVAMGVPLGAVGRTGNAANTPPHLHIGVGPSIQAGVGPQGGTGGAYDAITLLRGAQRAGSER